MKFWVERLHNASFFGDIRITARALYRQLLTAETPNQAQHKPSTEHYYIPSTANRSVCLLTSLKIPILSNCFSRITTAWRAAAAHGCGAETLLLQSVCRYLTMHQCAHHVRLRSSSQRFVRMEICREPFRARSHHHHALLWNMSTTQQPRGLSSLMTALPRI